MRNDVRAIGAKPEGRVGSVGSPGGSQGGSSFSGGSSRSGGTDPDKARKDRMADFLAQMGHR
jgi:hypothetical protein